MSKIEIIESNFTVVVGYKYDSFMDIGPLDDIVLDIAERNRTSSSAENGTRMIFFNFLTKEEAVKMVSRLILIQELTVDCYQEQDE